MNDIGSQLREAMSAAVADAEPPHSIMELVRRRYRRRNRRKAAVGALALSCAIAAVPVIGTLLGSTRHAPADATATPLFPGGDRILFSTGAGSFSTGAGSLLWLYPDGRTVSIASGFTGAIAEGTGLLAWKQTSDGFSYYTMNLDGSNLRLVLPARHSKQLGNIYAQLSPDGSRLIYVVQDIISIRKVTDEIWSADLATGQERDLGPGSQPVWKDSSTILADSADQRSLLLVNVKNGRRKTYLTVTNPQLIRAYQDARPGAGPPNNISAEGWSTGASTSALAVSLTVVDSFQPSGDKPVEIILEPGRVLAFAADRNPLQSLTWGPDGIFLLHTGHGDNPSGWNTYVGTLRSKRLSRPETFGEPWTGVAFSPRGDVIAFGYDDGTIAFVPVPAPACQHGGRCLHFQPIPLFNRGTLQAWERQ
jgi:hypothetical protein